MKKDFYQEQSFFTLECINTVDEFVRRENQPSFIQMFMINGKKVAFMGEKPVDEDTLHGKFIRINKTVIPEAAHLVNTKVLREQLQNNRNARPIDTNTPGFFIGHKVQTNIIMNVCSYLDTHTYHEMHFHACKNHIHPAPDFLTDLGPGEGGSCPLAFLSSYVDDSSAIKHEQVMFYISKEDIDAADKRNLEIYKIDHPEKNYSCNVPVIQKLLATYFNENLLKEKIAEDEEFIRLDGKHFKGIFLIPMVFTDDRIVYYCLPDVMDISSHSELRQATKNKLLDWLNMVEKFNAEEDKVLLIAGDETNFVYVEEWSIFIGKNNLLKTLDEDKLYLPEVIERRISSIT